jgi:hypothetical protein
MTTTTPTDDLKDMIPSAPKERTYKDGTVILIKQIVVGRVPELINAVMPIYMLIKSVAAEAKDDSAKLNKTQLMAMFMHNSDACLAVLAALSGKPRAWVDNLEIDEALDLLLDLVEVNLDFFVKNVLPLLLAGVTRMAQNAPSNTTLAGLTASKT